MAEVALKVAAVRVDPLAADELAILELADVLLSRLEVDVGALAVLLSIGPVARVDVLVRVGHDAFAVPLPILPVTVVLADLGVHLLADSVLVVVNPGALVLDWLLLGVGPRVSVVSLSMAFLLTEKAYIVRINSYGKDEKSAAFICFPR